MPPTQLICDTNVFYNLGSGRLKSKDVAAAGEAICFSPVSVLELASKLSDATHASRRQAAQAILDTGATQLPDPESFLTSLWGLVLKEPSPDWSHAVKAIAASKDMAELRRGVADYRDGVWRTLRPTVAGSWRTTVEDKWVRDMLSIQAKEIPGFEKWYDPDPKKRRGARVPRLKKKAKDAFLNRTTSMDWMTSCFVAMQCRAFLKADRSIPFAPSPQHVKTLLAAMDAVSCFCAVYTHYVVHLLTDGALPRMNDSGDIELYCYSTDDSHVVVTADDKWKRLADRAGYGERVRVVS